MNKKLMALSFATIATLSTFSYAEANKVRAETTSKYSPVVQRLIDNFHLNTAEVDNIITQTRTDHQAQRLKTIDTKLTTFVSENKLTEDQKTKLLTKIKEWQETKDDWKTLTPEQRREKRQEHRDDMLNWAKENGIDTKYLVGLGNGQFFRGFARGYKAGNNSN